MSDEIATDEAGADEYEIHTLRNDRLEAEENADGKTGPPGNYSGVRRDEVVFDIGEEGESDDEHAGSSKQAATPAQKRRDSDIENAASGEESRLRKSSETDRRSLPPRYSSLG